MSGLLPYDRRRSHGVFKSGALLISAKGLGWKSWKRRWFVLTRTSLIFFKAEPKGQVDPSLALGGIDLNNSGSVHARLEKKLLTVLFPDGRAFTLKAESAEDLEEWRQALERALAVAPNPQLLSSDGIFHSDGYDASDYSGETKAKRPAKSLVVGRPILLALEDIDGSPSFLEKALTFMETHGAQVEGVLRQSADIDHVEQRVREYEEGKNTFSPNEDAHVIGDCIKHVLRELPSSPVPAPCCVALLEALGLDPEPRTEALRAAVADTFPEPNRRLLQRVLQMMKAVASHSETNRMTSDAVARCMAPLLLRPLLSGECTLDDSDISGDSTHTMLAAAQAANQANALTLMLMQDYEHIFKDEVRTGQGRLGQKREKAVPAMSVDSGGDGDPTASEDVRGVDGSEASTSGLMSDSFDFKITDFSGYNSGNPMPGGRTPPRPLGNGSWPLPPRGGAVNGRAGSYSGEIGGSGQQYRSPQQASPAGKAPAKEPVPFWNSELEQSVAGSTGDGEQDESLEKDVRSLEIAKEDLRTSLNKEAKATAVLRASWERKRQTLKERKLALSMEVVRLQDQLAAERAARGGLEAAMGQATALLSQSGQLEPATRGQLEEIATMEAVVMRLRNQVQELGAELAAQRGGLLKTGADRQHRIEALSTMRIQLEAELGRLNRLCIEERRRNEELEMQDQGSEQAAALERHLAHQRLAVLDAQTALRAEMARGQEMRRRSPAQVPSPQRHLSGELGGARGALMLQRLDVNAHLDDPSMSPSARSMNGGGESPGWDARSPDPTSPALSELNSKLEHFKERRSRLMQQLTALSEPITPNRIGHPPISPSP